MNTAVAFAVPKGLFVVWCLHQNAYRKMKGACHSPFEKSLLLDKAVCFHPSLHYQLNCWHQVFKEFQREGGEHNISLSL